MSYLSRNANRRRGTPTSTTNTQRNYSSRATSTRRHEFVATHLTGNLTGGSHIPIEMLAFKRTFSATVEDVEPTPTAGNNFQSTSVMNGSRINNYQSRILINNLEGSETSGTMKGAYLDVYEIVLSFFDGYLWEEFDTGASQASLINFNQSTASINAGEVEFLTTQPTLSRNNVMNNKFTQQYLRHAGRVWVPQGETAVLPFSMAPPKCRRSNSGMFWGIVLHNDAVINQNTNLALQVSQEISFDEVPSDERLPFIY